MEHGSDHLASVAGRRTCRRGRPAQAAARIVPGSYPVAMDRELFDAYLHDRSRLGPAEKGAFTGAAGGAACGDLSRISLVLEEGSITRVSFDAEGCGATLAATAAVAEMVEGSPVLDVARIGTDEVDEAIGGLTPAKRHAAQLAADALHRALAQVA